MTTQETKCCVYFKTDVRTRWDGSSSPSVWEGMVDRQSFVKSIKIDFDSPATISLHWSDGEVCFVLLDQVKSWSRIPVVSTPKV